MKIDDYQSDIKAQNYLHKRFKGKLSIVSKDELSLIESWIKNFSKINRPVITDIGAGTGRSITSLLKFNPTIIYAVDISQYMLNVITNTYSKINDNPIKTVYAKSDKIPIKSSSVDLALSLHLLKHLQDIEPTVKEANRILKKDGIFIFDVINKNSIAKFNLGTCFAMDDNILNQILNKNGFRIRKIYYLHYLGETIYSKISILTFLLHSFDYILSIVGLKLGSKIFILAQKI